MPAPGSPSKLLRRAQLYDQWATMLSAGLPMVRSLTVLSESTSLGPERRTYRKVLRDLERGQTLGEALDRAGNTLPELDRAVLAMGERTGRMEYGLKLLAESCRRNGLLLRDALSGTIYPLIVLHVALLVFPVSHIVTLVVDGNGAPFLLHKLRVFSVLYGTILVFWQVVPRIFRSGFKGLAEGLLRPVPILGKSLRQLAVARLAFALDVQLAAGIGAIEAWMRAAEVCGSPALRREIRAWEKPLAQGATPGQLATQSRRLSGLFSEFYLTGETSGRLEECLRQIEQVYREEGSHGLRAVADWVPRIIYFGIVLYAILGIFSFYTSYFSRFDF